LEKETQREFYAEMCRVERWSVRTLRERIRGILFERTAISRKPVRIPVHVNKRSGKL
jgi:predicted nuclease of restriction endonuclease-like (RecB) superfamily